MSLSHRLSPFLGIALSTLAFLAATPTNAEGINYDEGTNRAFLTIDEPFEGSYDLALRFGGSLQEFLTFNRTADRFEFSNDVYINGSLEVAGATTLGGIAYSWPTSPAAFSGLTLQVDPSTGQLTWGSPVLFIRKPSDEAVSASTTPQDDDDFSVYVGANETWVFQYWISAATTTTADYRFAVSGQNGSSCEFVMSSIEQAVANRSSDCDAAPTNFTMAGPSTADLLLGFVTYSQGATAGNVTLQWAQSAASSTTTFRAGSYMIGRRVE